MAFTSQAIYPLAQTLHTLLPSKLDFVQFRQPTTGAVSYKTSTTMGGL